MCIGCGPVSWENAVLWCVRAFRVNPFRKQPATDALWFLLWKHGMCPGRKVAQTHTCLIYTNTLHFTNKFEWTIGRHKKNSKKNLSISFCQVPETAQCCDPDYGFDPTLLCSSDGCIRQNQRVSQSSQTHLCGDPGDCTITPYCCPAMSRPPRPHGPAADPLLGSGSMGTPTAVQG